MAITLHQQPTTPNGAFADLIWVASSTNQNQPQFQFVATIQASGSSDTITLKQQPGPSGYGVFNMGSIATTLVEYDQPWKTPFVQSSSFSGKTIITTFSEEYGTSTSSSVTVCCTITGSQVYIIPAVVEPDAGYWNFPASSYYTASTAPNVGAEAYLLQHGLTDSPLSQSIRDDEYQTISILNGNFDNSDTNAQDIYYIQVSVFNEAGSNIQNLSWFNLNSGSIQGGPRTANTEEWGDGGVYNGQTEGTKLVHIAAGPKNFSDGGTTLNASWYRYLVSVWGQESAGVESNTGRYAQYWFTKQTAECGYTGTRFAFINEFGVYDYYTFPFADSISDSMTRSEYTQTFVDYSTTFGGVTYNASRRGAKVFNQDYSQNRVAESGYLTQEEADWLRQLVESPEVFIQSGTTFLPVVITNSDFTFKTNPRTQKLYRLTLTYKMANQKRSR
jgi:hypothetical protein